MIKEGIGMRYFDDLAGVFAGRFQFEVALAHGADKDLHQLWLHEDSVAAGAPE